MTSRASSENVISFVAGEAFINALDACAASSAKMARHPP